MGNCCSDEIGHAGAHPVGPAASASAAAASAAADRFLRSKGAGASTQIEISLSASNLGDQEYFPKINPMVVVYSKGKDGQLEEIGRSEVIFNSLNPSWSRKISVHYQFEILQPLVFQLYNINPQFHDVTEKMLKLEEQEFLGEATCLLSEALAPHSTFPISSITGQNSITQSPLLSSRQRHTIIRFVSTFPSCSTKS